MNTSRTKNAVINSIVAIISQILMLLISFIGRTFFIKILGSEYLGINGLFTNILSILSFAELGIGTAIIYSLYKPIAENNEKKISAFANLYKKAYRIIGIIILVVGVAIIPLLPYVIKDYENYKDLKINFIYFLFLLNSAITYFYSYKRSIIVANQQKYIDSINRVICLILLNVTQIVALYQTHNYTLYLIIQIIYSIIENISITIIANKKYPFLMQYKNERINKEEKQDIVTNVKALVMHKIGSTLVSNTDNLLMSALIGLNTVGIYSNYNLIITAIKTVINQVFTSITSSVGNLTVEEDKEKSYNVFWRIEFINFWLVSMISTILLAVLNDFITIWIGEEYLLDNFTLVIIIINFYLYEMRQTLFIYKNTYAIFKNDKYVPIIEAIINLVTSIILAKYMGIAGIFIGTIISTVTTCFWTEPYILYKVKFKKSLKEYFKKYFLYMILTIIISYVGIKLCSYINGTSIIGFILKSCLAFLISNLLLLLCLHRTKEFSYYKNLIINKFWKKRRKNNEYNG